MSDITLKLDPVAMREATSQAIMGVLTAEVRTELIQSAIRQMLNPSKNSWEKGQSPIEVAFLAAANQVAREVALEVVKADEGMKVKLKELLEQAAAKILQTDTDKLAERMADSFVNSLRRD